MLPTHVVLRGAFSNFCPFALKARSTTLIFVECITFHQTSLLDDVHKVLAVFIGHKLCFLYVFLVYPSYTEIQQIWSYIDIEITCLKELLVTQKIIRTHRVQYTVNIWCVAARKLCLIVDSQVMIWSCTLFYKNSHQHFYGLITILVPFWQYLRSLSMNMILITLQ